MTSLKVLRITTQDELQKLHQLDREKNGILRKKPSNYVIRAGGSILHDFYTGVEIYNTGANALGSAYNTTTSGLGSIYNTTANTLGSMYNYGAKSLGSAYQTGLNSLNDTASTFSNQLNALKNTQINPTLTAAAGGALGGFSGGYLAGTYTKNRNNDETEQ